MNGTGTTIGLAIQDTTVRSRLEKLVQALDGVAFAEQGKAADILLCDVAANQEKDLMRAAQLQNRSGAMEVFLTCADPAPEFLIQAMRLGFTEVLPQPVDHKDLSRAVERFGVRHRAQNDSGPDARGRIITVAGAKSGAGTTTLAVNLAVELQRVQGSTALLDLRRPMGEIPLFLDLEYSYTWDDVLQNLSRLDPTYLNSVMARHASGVSVLASPGQSALGLEDGSGSMERVLDVMRTAFGLTVIDADPGLETLDLREVELADLTLLVMNLSLPCLAHVKRVLERIRRRDGLEKKVRLVANRSLRDADISVRDAEDILQKKIAATVADDYPGTLTAMNQGKPLMEAAPKSPVLKSLSQLARGLARTADKKRNPLLSLLKGRKNDKSVGRMAAGAGAS